MFFHPSTQPTEDETFLLLNESILSSEFKNRLCSHLDTGGNRSSIMKYPQVIRTNVKTNAINSDKSCFVNSSM